MAELISYPHMSKRESAIWGAFMRNVRLPKGVLYYDARVGRPIPAEPGESPWVSSVRQMTSRKRLDAVLITEGAVWIFEVKVRGGLSAVGQAIGYEYLFGQAIRGESPVYVVLVCDVVVIDVDNILAHEGIGLYVVHAKRGDFWNMPELYAAMKGIYAYRRDL